jgi:hypothetical protein
VGYAPEEAPEIVVVALFENGEHGDRASWIVRDVLKAYFDKKARESKSESQSARAQPFVPRALFTPPSSATATLTVSLPEGFVQ